MPPQAASCQVVHCAAGGNSNGKNVWRWRVFEGKGEGISEQISCIFSELSGGPLSSSLSLSVSLMEGGTPLLPPDWLDMHGRKWTDVAIVHLHLSDMDDFSLVNSIYCTFFPSRPPARYTLEVLLQ